MPAVNRQSSIGVTIKIGENITLDNVSDIPDLGASPEQIDVTAIGDDTRKYIAGISDPGELEFTCFYEKEIYGQLDALKNQGEQDIVVTFKDGSSVTIKGTVAVALAGFGVGDAVTFTMSLAISEIKWSAGAGE